MPTCQVCLKYVEENESIMTKNYLLVCNDDNCRTYDNNNQAIEKIDNVPYVKSMKIYNLLHRLYDVNEFHMNYDSIGGLNFSFRSKAVMDCKIKPNEDNSYSMKFSKTFNMCQMSILKEFNSVSEDELYLTFINTVNFLDAEYIGNNMKSWWGYGEMIRI